MDYGVGGSENVGQDLYQSNSTRSEDFGHGTGQGVQNTVLFLDVNVNYLLNPANGLMLEAGVQNRMIENNDQSSVALIYFGIKTGIFNSYIDF